MRQKDRKTRRLKVYGGLVTHVRSGGQLRPGCVIDLHYGLFDAQTERDFDREPAVAGRWCDQLIQKLDTGAFPAPAAILEPRQSETRRPHAPRQSWRPR
jgi:hypothetical protein